MNALSLGCSGLNTLMGPLRPAGIAATSITLSILWVVSWPMHIPRALLTTCLSLLLTLSPELVEWRHRKRLAVGGSSLVGEGGVVGEWHGGDVASSRSRAAAAAEIGGGGVLDASRVIFDIEKGAMGCISCVSKVSSKP